MRVVLTPIMFFLLGLLFGAIAGRGAWAIIAIPVIFGLLDLSSEGFDVYSLVLILVSVAAAVIGVLVGKMIARRRFQHEPSPGGG